MNHHQLAKLDLRYIALLLDNDEVADGFGNSKHISSVVADFAESVASYCHCIENGFPDGYRLYVPDFWHITHGRAKSLTKEDGTLLWDVASFLMDAMKPLEASGTVKRIYFEQFEEMDIEVENDLLGSMYVWQ